MNHVDPSAIVSPQARIGDGNVIGAYAVIGPGVEIGDDNWIGSGVVLGAVPEHRAATHGRDWEHGEGESAQCFIGSGNVLRERVVIQRGFREPTTIADGCYVMTNAYVAHDSKLESDVTLSANVALAGHAVIRRGANLGIGAAVRQHIRIGVGAMVGMGSVVVADVTSFSLAFGCPAVSRGVNRRGLERLGVAADEIDELEALVGSAQRGEWLTVALRQWEVRYEALLEKASHSRRSGRVLDPGHS